MSNRWVARTNGDESWRMRAECRPGNGYDPETWFPRQRNQQASTVEEDKAAAKQRRLQQKRAKEVCEFKCPVRLECLNYAMNNDEREGIWGGQTPSERGVTPLR